MISSVTNPSVHRWSIWNSPCLYQIWIFFNLLLSSIILCWKLFLVLMVVSYPSSSHIFWGLHLTSTLGMFLYSLSALTPPHKSLWTCSIFVITTVTFRTSAFFNLHCLITQLITWIAGAVTSIRESVCADLMSSV